MKTTTFHTPTELDLRALTLFGVSVKECKSPIGHFGTGLKYAIAVLLRNQLTVEISISGKSYTFDVEESLFRGQPLETVVLESKEESVELPFTTQLGRDWELWMAYRELYSNTVDEGGSILSGNAKVYDLSGTFITITGDDFALVAEREKAILDKVGLGLIHQDPDIEIYDGPSKYIYYRGIRAFTLNHASVCTYNIKRKMELTEDRTIKYGFYATADITESIARSHRKDMLLKVLTAELDTFEGKLEFNSTHELSPEFLAVCAQVEQDQELGSSGASSYSKHLNLSAAVEAKAKIGSVPIYKAYELTNEEQSKMVATFEFIEKAGFDFSGIELQYIDIDLRDMYSYRADGMIQIPRDETEDSGLFLIKEWFRVKEYSDQQKYTYLRDHLLRVTALVED